MQLLQPSVIGRARALKAGMGFRAKCTDRRGTHSNKTFCRPTVIVKAWLRKTHTLSFPKELQSLKLLCRKWATICTQNLKERRLMYAKSQPIKQGKLIVIAQWLSNLYFIHKNDSWNEIGEQRHYFGNKRFSQTKAKTFVNNSS